ncbi:MAG: endonuclease/exonuclease/phosphatase family protein [Verrucomicrobiota bacterium]
MALIRILSWNLLQGGGRRREAIIENVTSHHPDIFAIQEFRSSGGPPLVDALYDHGLTHFHAPAAPSPTVNTPAIASRWPFDVIRTFPAEGEQPRFLHLRFDKPDAKVDLDVIVLHLPHKKEQVAVFDALNALPASLRHGSALLIGDFNCGIPFKDSESRTFENTRHFQQLLRDGWIDAWRKRYPQDREFSWISTKKNSATAMTTPSSLRPSIP